jgi:hypothetical protein
MGARGPCGVSGLVRDLVSSCTISDIDVTILDDGYRMKVPLALLGGDEGQMEFVLTSSAFIGEGTECDRYTGVLDTASQGRVAV